MNDAFGTKLKCLGFHLPKWRLPPSENLVHEFEQGFSLNLPADYRDFLVRYGGFWVAGGATCPCQEPTPCGGNAMIVGFFGFTSPDRNDNVVDETKRIDGCPDFVAVGENGMGDMIWLKCTWKDAGYVYMYDHENRSAWTDEMFYRMFPNLSAEIREYLKLRREGNLPRKPRGYEHVYQVATNFTDFINRLEKRPSDRRSEPL